MTFYPAFKKNRCSSPASVKTGRSLLFARITLGKLSELFKCPRNYLRQSLFFSFKKDTRFDSREKTTDGLFYRFVLSVGIFDVCFTKKVKSREKNERSCGRIRVVGGDLSSLRSPSTEIGSRARQEDAVKSFQRG